ncbi:DUF559 domain-containing protein [Streptomyces sp. Ag109_O5-1]|uniref:DUF559 domain-containing protein n=1 Tax=Streptomyces sp. Ag109_O5-1 TaxID=1938851 RepID=UPI001627E947|nr:DUF559 domain-containing protein [Streptomyces sp. Ag109_O5-1]
MTETEVGLPDRTPTKAGNRPRTVKQCAACGGDFLIAASMADRYTTCSKSCASERKRAANHRGTEDRTCERCGARFTVRVSHLKGGRTGAYCSNACRLAALNAVSRQPPAATANCRICGESFRRPACFGKPDADGKTRGVYCSRLCMWTDDDYRKRRAAKHSPTRLEKWLFEVLDAAGVEYEKFATVGRYVPDALLPQYRVILEVDGVVWHRKRVAYDKQRDVDLTAAGYTVIHFTDVELISRPRAHALLSAAVAGIQAGQAAYRPAKLWKVTDGA